MPHSVSGGQLSSQLPGSGGTAQGQESALYVRQPPLVWHCRRQRAARCVQRCVCFAAGQPPAGGLPHAGAPDGDSSGWQPAPRLGRGWHVQEPFFRFWVDFQVLSSPESTTLLQRALRLVGGVCTGGPPKVSVTNGAAAVVHKDYGYMHMGDWDLLWSITAKAMLAAEILRPGQLVGIIPGFLSITRKTSLVSNLRLVYGDAHAFSIVPRTFKLPDEMDDWASWIQSHREQDTGLWMLKNNKQRGTGLRLVRTAEAFQACFETTYRPGLEGMKLYKWYLAQQYITKPMLLNGHKFGIRIWALVPGVRPLRVYVHRNGLALMSSHAYDLEVVSDDASGVAPGHVTNYAQNENGMVWSLRHFAAHMGRQAFSRLWDAMLESSALLFAAALPRVREVQASVAMPPQSGFQLFGLDFLVDVAGKPWLLEANATPSMKVEHEDAATRRLIHDQKWPVVMDMVNMLGICPQRFQGPLPKEHTDISFLSSELQRRGGFLPIMHKLPAQTPGEGLRTIEWSKLDMAVRKASVGFADLCAFPA